MNELGNYLITLIGQFAGGPGPLENNLVRFGLAALLWAALLAVAWSRQRSRDLPREKLLLWGFGLGLARELFMLSQVTGRMLTGSEFGIESEIHQPLEHALTMAAIVAVAGAFLRYALDDERLSRRYLQLGGATTAVVLIIALVSWPRQVRANPQIFFHETWVSWTFHMSLSTLIAAAIFFLARKRGWLTNVVILALAFFFLGEFLILLNYATDKSYSQILCPIANSFHILAIPVLGYVYLREQSIEKKQAEEMLATYREHLEELVEERTAALEAVNGRLREEVYERGQAELAFEQLSQRYELILASAGEGICGLDRTGRYTFVNPAAAGMLGYGVAELTGRPSHAVWLHSKMDGTPYRQTESPIYAAHKHGVIHHGEDHIFWRKDGTCFPVRYIANPARTRDELAGAVVVFRDITERKEAEAEIAQRNARLAAQNAVASTLSQSLDLDSILSSTVDTVLSLLELKFGLILLLDPDTAQLSLQTVRGCILRNDLVGHVGQQCSLMDISVAAATEMRTVSHAVFDSPSEDPPEWLVRENIQMLISTPLISKGRAVGSLTIGSQHSDAVQQPILEQLTAIGQQIAMAVENARLYQAAERWADELNLLHQVSNRLTSTLDPDTINEAIPEQSTRLLGCDMASLFRWPTEHKECRLVASYGMSQAAQAVLHNHTYPWRLLQELASNKQPIVIADAQTDPRIPHAWRRQLDVCALLCLPVWRSADAIEFLVLMDRTVRAWRPEDIRLIESFARRAAIALANANLHRQAELAAALEERQRIAANMHDGLAQVLSYMSLKTDRALDLLENGHIQEVLDEFHQVRSAIDRASHDVRRSIASLQAPPQPRRSLQDSLSQTAGEFAVENEPPVEVLNLLSAPIYLSPNDMEQVLRVVQEAILNARRHAQAQRITVCVRRLQDTVEVVVQDDGRGFQTKTAMTQNGEHFGLSIMRARAARIQGTMEIDTEPGRGTRVVLTWPANHESIEVEQQDGRQTFERKHAALLAA